MASLFPQPDASPRAWAHRVQQCAATARATQNVVDIAAFIGKVETERSLGRPAPKPQPMQDVLGAFRGAPAMQTTIQILAAAATARHFGARSAGARTWETLAQDNAARLEVVRAQQYRQEQARYLAAQTPPEQVQQRTAERAQAEVEKDRRVFDAAAALALSYVTVKSLPSFEKLVELSNEHLEVPDPDHDYVENAAETEAGRTRDEEADRDTGAGVDSGNKALDTAAQTSADVVGDADGSDELEQVPQPRQKSGIGVGNLGSALGSVGRGIAIAIGPTHEDDDIAPPLSPVDLPQLSQELLGALGAAMSGHPRSVTGMLKIKREPARVNEVASVPEMGIEPSQEMTVGY